jgi:hypothetical protein
MLIHIQPHHIFPSFLLEPVFLSFVAVSSQEVWCTTGPWPGLTMCEIMWSQDFYWGHAGAGNRGKVESCEEHAFTLTKPNLSRTHLGNVISLEGCTQRFWTFVHRWASTLISLSAISNIRYRHLLFRYRWQICRTKKCHYDIRSVPISTSKFIPISDIEEKKYFTLQIWTRAPWIW